MPIQRYQLPNDSLWNTESYFVDAQAWQCDLDRLADCDSNSQWSQILSRRGLLQNIEDASFVCDHFFDLQRQIELLFTYAQMRRDEDTLSEEHQVRMAKAEDLLSKFQITFSWIDTEFAALRGGLDHLIKSDSLQTHKFYLEKIQKRQPHHLPLEQEILLVLSKRALSTPQMAFGALNDSDFTFPPALDSQGTQWELTHGTFAQLLRSDDRALRQSAFENIHGVYRNHQHLIAQLQQGNCQTHIFEARARKFKTSLHAALFEHDIPIDLYENLITTVKSRVDLLQRYMALRKKILAVDKLQVWDLHVPLANEMNHKFTYEEASELVIASSAALGDEYQKIVRSGLQRDRWVDRFETSNKRSGAYSSGCWRKLPLILMNYQGSLQDVFTLSHEVGHSMHSFLSWQAQPYQTSDYSIFAAEVASAMSEELLFSHLLEKATNKRQKARLIYQKIEEIRSTLFRQTLFAEFEWRMHEICENGEAITASTLNALYHSLNREYCGDECDFPPISWIEWARIPHLYYNFYVFQYATGISAALHLSAKIKDDNSQKAHENYLAFLASGGSDYPIKQLCRAGVDMVTPEPILAALSRFEQLVKELEFLLGQ